MYCLVADLDVWIGCRGCAIFSSSCELTILYILGISGSESHESYSRRFWNVDAFLRTRLREAMGVSRCNLFDQKEKHHEFSVCGF